MLQMLKNSLCVVGVALAATPCSAATVYILTDENDLLTIDSGSPLDLVSGGAISGLGNQDLIGIDVRPSNLGLYGVGNLGGVFLIDPVTRNATLVSSLSADGGDLTAPFTTLSGTRFGLDFNPVPDRLRITSDLETNLRANVDTGATITDDMLVYGPGQLGATGDNPNIGGSAYTNPDNDPSTGTMLYNIDVRGTEDRLVIQNPPNNGTLTVVGALGVNASALLGFDIYLDANGNNVGLAAMQMSTGGISQLYSINLNTGQATLLGDIGGGDLVDGLAVVIPEPATLALLALGGLAIAGRRR